MISFNNKAIYSVAVKVFLRDGDKLLIVHDVWGDWELPGGRIKLHEFQKPLVETVERKMREELGENVKYSEPQPTGTFFQVKRMEKVDDTDKQEVRIFAIGFEAQYLGGEIDLGKAHDQIKWVDVNNFEPLKLQNNDWMRGVADYLKKIKETK